MNKNRTIKPDPGEIEALIVDRVINIIIELQDIDCDFGALSTRARDYINMDQSWFSIIK